MAVIPLKGGQITRDRRLDRLVHFDERSRAFPIRALLPTNKPRSYTWSVPVQLDQGYEGACVGFSVSHEAAARPAVVSGITNDVAREVYYRAKKLDPWEGEAYEGTSVLAGIKAGRERGWYTEFRWGFGLDDALLTLGYRGPGVAGLNWREGMMDTDAGGFIRTTGEVIGGHAILVRGVNIKGRFVLLRNSWGSSWGVNGDCKLSFDDFDLLLRDDGEFCIPVNRSRPVTPMSAPSTDARARRTP